MVNNRSTYSNSETANFAMVGQSFDWEDQIQALNNSGPKTANSAQISELPDENVEAKMMQLQFAFMVSTTLEKKQISEISCSKKPMDTVKFLHD